MILTSDSFDPLTAAMAPPANESPIEKLERERREEEALQVSRRIDAELKAAKMAMKKRKKAIKVLVLGQSLSGKSTTIKNFQMTYANKSWVEERASWRAVVLLNLVRSVNTIMDIVSEEIEASQRSPPSTSSSSSFHSAPFSTATSSHFPTETHRSVILKLTPLREIEKDLKSLLGSGSSEVEDLQGPTTREQSRLGFGEFSVRSTSGWKSILNHIRNPEVGKESDLHRVACHVIAGCREDIQWLWSDETTQYWLRKRCLRIEDAPGFFLDDVRRITSLDYEPSDEDIVRARLRTTGVQEYCFALDRVNSTALDWIIYDVAGIRTARAAWIPYFKDITAIIFMAPLSSFNEVLAEDDRVNRLEDTFVLWKTVCSSKLLANVQMILFMNKTDVLQGKLDRGIKVKDYIPEFQNRSNDYETVSTWFRRVFRRIYNDNSPPRRPFNSHFTSVIDTKSTAQTLCAVQAAILRHDVADAGLM